MSPELEGIQIEHHQQIFDSFFQVKAGYLDKSPGIGLGLTLAKKMVEKHNGTIWVESQGMGKGSKFSFKIPVRQPNN